MLLLLLLLHLLCINCESVAWVRRARKSKCLRVDSSRVESSRAEWDMKIAPNISIILSGHRSVQSMPARRNPAQSTSRPGTQESRLSPPPPQAFMRSIPCHPYPSIRLSVYLFRCLPPFGASVLLLLPSPPSLLPTFSPSLLTNAHQSAHNGDGIIVFVFSMQSYAKYIHDLHTHTHIEAYIVYNVCVYMLAVCVCVWHTLSLLYTVAYTWSRELRLYVALHIWYHIIPIVITLIYLHVAFNMFFNFLYIYQISALFYQYFLSYDVEPFPEPVREFIHCNLMCLVLF